MRRIVAFFVLFFVALEELLEKCRQVKAYLVNVIFRMQ